MTRRQLVGLPELVATCTALDEPTPEQLRALRKAADLTQQELAKLIGLGHANRVAEYENGTRRMPLDRFALMLLCTDQHPVFRLRVRTTR